MLGLFRELKRLFEKANWTIWDYDEEIIKQYYFPRKRIYLYLGIEIKKLPYNLIATLSIEIDHYMYFGFTFTEMNKKEHPASKEKRDGYRKNIRMF